MGCTSSSVENKETTNIKSYNDLNNNENSIKNYSKRENKLSNSLKKLNDFLNDNKNINIEKIEEQNEKIINEEKEKEKLIKDAENLKKEAENLKIEAERLNKLEELLKQKEERLNKEEEERLKKLEEERIKNNEQEKIKKEEEEKLKKEEERLKQFENELKQKEELLNQREEKLKKQEEESKKKEEEEKNKKEEEERIKKEEEEKLKKQEEERIKKEEEERIKKEEEEKKKKEEEERIKKEEEEKKKKEEEEKKKKEEEEKKKKEEEEKKKKEEEENKKANNNENDIEYQKFKEEELSKILPCDIQKPSQNCVFLGVHGSYFTDKEKALKRINDIRKEACNEGVKDPDTNKKFKPSDYKPLKWSTNLEFVSRIRAFEGGLTMGHKRLNGKDIWTVQKNGVRSWGENLAWNWDSANSIDMINQWYDEKKDWVTGGKGVTGHYESLISSGFNYVGLGWFNSKCTKYPSCLAGSFSNTNKGGEDYIEEKRDIIQTLDVLKSSINSYYLEGRKVMKTGETQMLTPRIKLKNPELSVWPLKISDLNFVSNNPKIAKVSRIGKVEAFKAGNATITCKNPDNTNFATFIIEVKCTHEKKLIKTVDSTCTKEGTNTYECDICKTKVDSKINMKPHDYKFVASNGKSTGTCTKCKKVIKCNPPTMFEIYWRNDQTTEGSSYWSCLPSNNPIGSTIVGWVHKINGDQNYRELIAECDNECALELPNDKIEDYVYVKVVGSGTVNLTIYSKYNPTVKHSYELYLGD